MSLALVVSPTDSESELDLSILDAWGHHRDLLRQRRDLARATAPELARSRAELGAKLSEKQELLSSRGCDGQFSTWLRQYNIPSSTAYNLIKLHKTVTNPPTWTIQPAVPPEIELRGDCFTLRLGDKRAAMMHHALNQLTLPTAPRLNLAARIVSAVIDLTWANTRNELEDMKTAPLESFTRARTARLPPIRVAPGDPGAVLPLPPVVKAAQA